MVIPEESSRNILLEKRAKSISFISLEIKGKEKRTFKTSCFLVLYKKNIFPAIIIKILEAGEKTGTLDKSMEEISNYMDYQVSSTLKTVISLLEPLMLIFVGLLVGAMMMSIIGPIYGLIGQVGGK